MLQRTELGREEGDLLAVLNLVTFDSAKHAHDIKHCGIATRAVFRVERQGGDRPLAHGSAQLSLDESRHHEGHDMHVQIGHHAFILFE